MDKSLKISFVFIESREDPPIMLHKDKQVINFMAPSDIMIVLIFVYPVMLARNNSFSSSDLKRIDNVIRIITFVTKQFICMQPLLYHVVVLE